MESLRTYLGWNKTAKPMRIEELKKCRTAAYNTYVRDEYRWKVFNSMCTFVLIVIVGLYVYSLTTSTYRAPFPSLPNQTVVPLHIHVSLAVSSSDLIGMEEKMAARLTEYLSSLSTPNTLHIHWQVERQGLRSISSILSDSGTHSSLQLNVALVSSDQWTEFSATSVFLTKGNWALVQIRQEEDEAKIESRINHLVTHVMVGLNHIEVIAKRDARERLQSWQVAALPQQQQKRLVWDSQAISNVYNVKIVLIGEEKNEEVKGTCIISAIKEFSRRLSQVVDIHLSIQRLFDLNMESLLEVDVQDRKILNNANLHLLLKEVDQHLTDTQSLHPTLKIVVINSIQNVFIVDSEGEDSPFGVGVAQWGGVIVNGDRAARDSIGILRLLLGVDDDLPSGWSRYPSPLSQWELTRFGIRSIVDNSFRSYHSLIALDRLMNEVDNMMFSDHLSSLVFSSLSSLHYGLQHSNSSSLPHLKSSRQQSEMALSDYSLLSRLYFPSEQKFGILLPVFTLYFLPVALSLPGIIKYFIYRSP